jgi:hypothetical protein
VTQCSQQYRIPWLTRLATAIDMFAEQGRTGLQKDSSVRDSNGRTWGKKNFQSKGLLQLYVENESEGSDGLNLNRQSEACCFFPGRGTFPHLEHMFAVLPIFSLAGRWNEDKAMWLLSGQLYVNAHSGLYQHAPSRVGLPCLD